MNGSWFVRKWYRVERTYIGNLRDVNTKFPTEADARAFYDLPLENGQTEAVLYQWRNDGSNYDQRARKSRPKKVAAPKIAVAT